MDTAANSFTPRLSTSRQWTDLPQEFVTKVKSIFAEQFQAEAEQGEFIVEGRIYPGEILVRLGYLETGRLKQINFEASMDIAKPAPDATPEEKEASDSMNRLYVCIDALGSVMEEYFDLDLEEDEQIDIPPTWRAYDFEGDQVYLRHSTVNTRLENEADRILGLADRRLVHETDVGEDALGHSEIDSELAMAIQKAIRSGEYKLPDGHEPDSEPSAN